MPENYGPKYEFGYENPGAFEFWKRFEGNREYQRTQKGKGPYFENEKFYPGKVGKEKVPTVGYGHKQQRGENLSAAPWTGGLTELQAMDLLRADVNDRLKALRTWFDGIYGEGSFDIMPPNDKFALLDTKFQSNDDFPLMAGHMVSGDEHSAMKESWTSLPDPNQKAGERKRNLGRRLEAWPQLEEEYFDLGIKDPVRKIQINPTSHSTSYPGPPMQGPLNDPQTTGHQPFGPIPPPPTPPPMHGPSTMHGPFPQQPAFGPQPPPITANPPTGIRAMPKSRRP